jgi:hypothetical protein
MVKKSLNRATIVGTIMETNFTYDPKAENLFDKSIKGAYTKEDFKNPMFRVKVERHDNEDDPDEVTSTATVDVDMYSVFKQYSNPATKEKKDNPTFKAIKNLDNMENKGVGTRIRITGEFDENLYANDKGGVSRFNRVMGRYIETDPSKVPSHDCVDCDITGRIAKIADEIANEEETGRKLVDFYYITIQNDTPVANLLSLVVDTDLADDFENMYSVGDNVKLSLEIRDTQHGSTTESKPSFGHRKSDVASGYIAHEFFIFSGDEAYDDEDWEYYVDDKTMKQAMKARKVIEDDKIQKRKEKNGNSSTNEHKGLGKRKSDVTSEDEDGFVDGDDEDDEDNPFA